MIYNGSYFHQLDEKNRFRIPSKIKEQLGEHPFITLGANKCLLALSEAEAKNMFEKKFGDIDILDTKHSKAMRIMAANGFFAEEDNQGRILLPESLKKLVGIQKNIVTNGAFNRVEIWSEERWIEYSTVTADEFDSDLELMSKKEEV